MLIHIEIEVYNWYKKTVLTGCCRFFFISTKLGTQRKQYIQTKTNRKQS